jgi:arylsulfatase A-like enzyme
MTLSEIGLKKGDRTGAGLICSMVFPMGQDYQKWNLPRNDADRAVAITYAMIEAMDLGLARVFQARKDEGLWDKALIVFTSDSGPVPRRDAKHRIALTTTPLRSPDQRTREV